MANSPATKKQRIYEVAKDLGMSSDVIIQIAKKLGVEVKNHMSTLGTEVVDKVRSELVQEKAAAREEVVRHQEQEAQRARDERARAAAAPPAEVRNPNLPYNRPPGAGSAVVYRPPTPVVPGVRPAPTSPPQRPQGGPGRPGYGGRPAGPGGPGGPGGPRPGCGSRSWPCRSRRRP